LKIASIEYHGEFVRLTFQDRNGDRFIEVLPLEVWNSIRKIRRDAARQLINSEMRDGYHHMTEYIAGFSESHMLGQQERDPLCSLVVEKDDLQRIHQAIERLPQPQQSRVKAYLIDGFTYQKIADIEGVKYQTIQKSVSLAVEKIKKVFLAGV